MRFPTYQWREISLSESYRIRSLAILMILLHNFLHLIMNSPGENEFDYSAEKFQYFLDGLWNSPADFMRITFSYLGHYGVQVFFFLSGYGVALKHRESIPSWWSFVRKRLISLYPAIMLAALGYLLYEGLRLDGEEVFAREGAKLVRQIIGVSNFIPDNIYHPIGPWWFIGVIVQFYLIAPFLLKLDLWKPAFFLIGLIIGAILLEYFLSSLLMHKFSVNINHTILGHLDVCGLGMLAANYKRLAIPPWVFAIACVLFIAGNYDGTMWIAAGLAATILIIPLLRVTVTAFKKSRFLDRSMVYLGGLSMYMFLCNGYLRLPLLESAKEDPTWWKSISLCIVFLCLVIGWSILLRCLEKIFKGLFYRAS